MSRFVNLWRSGVLREERGKTVRLNRTWQKIQRVGVRQMVEDLVTARKPSEGFGILAGAGLSDLTAEYLAVKHADRFSPEVADAARARLAEVGITPPEVAS